MTAPEPLLDGRVRLHVGDMADVLASLPACSVDSVVCDPPYHLTSIVKRFGGDDRLGSKHPTVKPVDLMQWLVRLVTPRNGVVLDVFAGTGTTGEAAWREGFDAILVEREPAYAEDIRRRMALALAGPATRKAESVKARGTAADAGPLFALDGAAVDGPGGG